MKKSFRIILLLIIFFSLAASAQAATDTVVSYLDLPNAPDPAAGIPQYIKYIFIFSLGIVGIIAFIAMLIAAFNYVTSVGNPQKAAAAKDRIFSALLGMLLLLGSYLLLNTINPDLLKFKKEVATEIDIPGLEEDVFEEEDATGCRYTTATVEPTTVNVSADDSQPAAVSITLKRENCVNNEWENHEVKLDLRIIGERRCFAIIRAMENDPTNRINNSVAAAWYGIIHLNDGLCALCLAQQGQGNVICNMNPGAPETFVLRGEMELSNGRVQLMPAVSITAKDLTEDGDCCK